VGVRCSLCFSNRIGAERPARHALGTSRFRRPATLLAPGQTAAPDAEPGGKDNERQGCGERDRILNEAANQVAAAAEFAPAVESPSDDAGEDCLERGAQGRAFETGAPT